MKQLIFLWIACLIAGLVGLEYEAISLSFYNWFVFISAIVIALQMMVPKKKSILLQKAKNPISEEDYKILNQGIKRKE